MLVKGNSERNFWATVSPKWFSRGLWVKLFRPSGRGRPLGRNFWPPPAGTSFLGETWQKVSPKCGVGVLTWATLLFSSLLFSSLPFSSCLLLVEFCKQDVFETAPSETEALSRNVCSVLLLPIGGTVVLERFHQKGPRLTTDILREWRREIQNDMFTRCPAMRSNLEAHASKPARPRVPDLSARAHHPCKRKAQPIEGQNH